MKHKNRYTQEEINLQDTCKMKINGNWCDGIIYFDRKFKNIYVMELSDFNAEFEKISE